MVSGGFTGTESLASYVGFSDDGIWIEALPDLPVAVYQHCIVRSVLFNHWVIGGIQDGRPSNKTYLLNTLTYDWQEGPELNVPRSGASCGAVENFDYIVVAGGYNDDGHLSSTEVKQGC